ncbi:MAG: YbhB/YbcL family Raf kinase inhibitor-like protein, partial [Caulobacteraceae bacterium]
MSLRAGLSGAVAAGVFMAASAGMAEPPALGHTPQLAVKALPSRDGARLQVASPDLPSGGDIQRDNTQYGANRFPGASWASGPKGTRSYVVLIQGRDQAGDIGGPTSIHLTLYNIPAGITRLPEGMTAPPLGAVYGPNVHGLHAPYAGPHTHTAARHEYHLQVLALDTLIPTGGDPSYEALSRAMAGHVLASGDLVGYAAKPTDLASDAPAPIRIDTGLLQGAPGRDAAITVYKGVPYAAAPVGPLRWRAPQPAVIWTGVRKADAFGAACPQPTRQMVPADATMSEDCLTLNVWTGARAHTEKRPVYVWIYGGGFIGGTGSSPEFD